MSLRKIRYVQFYLFLLLIQLAAIADLLASCLIYSYAFKEYISSFGC